MGILVQLDRVTVRYGMMPPVFADLSLRLEAGSFTMLTGPTGAGKSTLLRLLALDLLPEVGSFSFAGELVSGLNRTARAMRRRQIGQVFQDFRLLAHLTVLENVALPLRVAGAPADDIVATATDLLRWVGLGERLDSLPAALSGGEQQRVAIARAVITRPRLLLADEPTGSVDDSTADRLLWLLQELHKLGTTILLATHHLHLLRRDGLARLHLERGRLFHA